MSDSILQQWYLNATLLNDAIQAWQLYVEALV
jgi:hypothetical protein